MIAELPTDEWSEHVASGRAYAGEGLQLAVAGQFAAVQLYNPVASGSRIRLFCLEPFAFAGIPINTNPRRYDTALTGFAPFGGPENLLGGGAASVAEIRNQSLVALVGSPFWLILNAGTTRHDYPTRHLDWGHDLLPGQGVILTSGAGGFMIVGFMWVEVPL